MIINGIASQLILLIVPGKTMLIVAAVFAAYTALLCIFCYLALGMGDKSFFPQLNYWKLFYKSLVSSLCAQIVAVCLALLLLRICADCGFLPDFAKAKKLAALFDSILKLGIMALGVCFTYIMVYSVGLRDDLPDKERAWFGFFYSFLAGGALISILDGLILLTSIS